MTLLIDLEKLIENKIKVFIMPENLLKHAKFCGKNRRN